MQINMTESDFIYIKISRPKEHIGKFQTKIL